MIRTLLLAELRKRWPEYLLASVAVALVAAALVAHRAVTDSAESAVHDLAHRLGKNMLVVSADTRLEDFYARRYDGPALPESVRETIAASPLAQHVRGMQLRLYGNVEISQAPAILVGDDGFSPGAAAMDPPPAVLGPALARRLAIGRGDVLHVGSSRFAVLEVADPAPDGLDDAVFVPLASAQKALGRPGEINAARLAGCWCSIDVASLASDVEKLLPGSRAITVAGMLKAQTGSVETMKRYSGVMYVAGAGIVALLIGALAAAQARRRTRELGLLVAIGAPPERLAAMFAAQAVVLGAAGGLAGWLLAIPATRWLGERVLGAPVAPPAGLLGTVVLLAAGVSVVAAMLPAARAVFRDPTVVLRES